MATRVRYHQVTLSPDTGDNEDLSTKVIPHEEAGWLQCVGAEFIGGGSDKRFLLHVVSFEPIAEPDESN